MQSANTTNIPRQIGQSSLVLIVASICGYGLSFAKEILVAARFGVGPAMDAFYAATTIPYLITGIIGSIITGIFIPVFTEYQTRDHTEAQKIVNSTFTYLSLFLIALMVLVFILAPFLVAVVFPGFNPATTHLTIKLLRLTSLLVFFSNHIYLTTAVLNAQKHFTIPAFSNMLVTITIIACLLWLSESLGIWALTIGLVAGTLLQMVTIGLTLKNRGYHYQPAFIWSHPGLVKMRQFGLLFLLAVLVTHLNILIDRFMASGLPAGSIAAYGYAGRLVDVLLQVFCFSVATAAFPYFVSDVVENKIQQLCDSFVSGVRMLGFILVPMTVFLVIMSRPIIQVLFQRGEFDSAATQITSITLACYVGQLFFLGVGILASRVLLAFKEMKTLLYLTVMGIVLKVLFNMALMTIISPPIAGIALATSGVYLVLIIIELVILRKWLIVLNYRHLLNGLLRTIGASLIMAISLVTFSDILHNQIEGVLFINQIVILLLLGIISLISFLGIALLLKSEEPNKIYTILKRWVFGDTMVITN